MELEKNKNLKFDETYLRFVADYKSYDEFYPKNFDEFLTKLKLNFIVEFDDGMPASSYTAIRLTKLDKSDIIVNPKGGLQSGEIEHEIKGLLLLVSSLVPYYYVGYSEWSKYYDENNIERGMGFTDVPKQKNLENYQNELSLVNSIMDEFKYEPLTAEVLNIPLWFPIEIETNIGKKPFTLFDCFFWWYD